MSDIESEDDTGLQGSCQLLPSELTRTLVSSISKEMVERCSLGRRNKGFARKKLPAYLKRG
jgi:hypothetical protein